MKRKSLVIASTVLFFSSFIFNSCKKVNEPTDLGGDLIPPIDNINTFEVALETETNNSLLVDTTILLNGDQIAIGNVTDPEFGKTDASAYFTMSSGVYGKYPFISKDAALAIDSVVLSLRYKGAYGDTLSNQTVEVFENSPSATINTTTFYKYTDADFPTNATSLGSKAFNMNSLNDSTPLRIHLNNSLGSRLASYDTTNTANGGFYNDSIFQTLFKGLSVKAGAPGSTLTYFDVFDTTKSKLIVYFRSTKDGRTDTAKANFYHLSVNYVNLVHPGGVANIVKRTPGGNWASYLANTGLKDDKLYIQSSPGSYVNIKIPGLSTMDNKVIHLAELIMYRLPSAQDNIFFGPRLLYLDKINNTRDTAFIFESDQTVGASGDVNYLGGNLKSDNTYRFNITRHVQGILTRKEPNFDLRLYAPLRTILNVKNNPQVDKITVSASDKIAYGRAVLAGGNYSDPSIRLRLRVVYSNL